MKLDLHIYMPIFENPKFEELSIIISEADIDEEFLKRMWELLIEEPNKDTFIPIIEKDKDESDKTTS